MTCSHCEWEDTEKCDDCQDPERDEMIKKLQDTLRRGAERIGGKPIDKEHINTVCRLTGRNKRPEKANTKYRG